MEDHCPIIVCTVAFGMGIDKPNGLILFMTIPKLSFNIFPQSVLFFIFLCQGVLKITSKRYF